MLKLTLFILSLMSCVWTPSTFQMLPEEAIASLDLQVVFENGVALTSAWSSDGKAITLGSVDGTVVEWNIENDTLKYLHHIVPNCPVRTIGLTSLGEYIVWELEDTSFILWRSEDPLIYSTFSGEHTDVIMRVAFSPNGSFLASVADILDPSIIIWDVKTNAMLYKLELDKGHLPFSIAFSPDSSILAIGRIPSAVELWDVETGERLDILTGLSLEVADIVWSPDGDTIAASAARLLSSTAVRPNPSFTIAAWDVTSGELLYARENPSDRDEVFQIALSPDGKWLASSTESGEIHLWDFESGKLLDTLKGHTDYVFDLAWSPDGQMLASVSADNTVIVWDSSLILSD